VGNIFPPFFTAAPMSFSPRALSFSALSLHNALESLDFSTVPLFATAHTFRHGPSQAEPTLRDGP
jgi:hypothetical protein